MKNKHYIMHTLHMQDNMMEYDCEEINLFRNKKYDLKKKIKKNKLTFHIIRYLTVFIVCR